MSLITRNGQFWFQIMPQAMSHGLFIRLTNQLLSVVAKIAFFFHLFDQTFVFYRPSESFIHLSCWCRMLARASRMLIKWECWASVFNQVTVLFVSHISLYSLKLSLFGQELKRSALKSKKSLFHIFLMNLYFLSHWVLASQWMVYDFSVTW